MDIQFSELRAFPKENQLNTYMANQAYNYILKQDQLRKALQPFDHSPTKGIIFELTRNHGDYILDIYITRQSWIEFKRQHILRNTPSTAKLDQIDHITTLTIDANTATKALNVKELELLTVTDTYEEFLSKQPQKKNDRWSRILDLLRGMTTTYKKEIELLNLISSLENITVLKFLQAYRLLND